MKLGYENNERQMNGVCNGTLQIDFLRKNNDPPLNNALYLWVLSFLFGDNLDEMDFPPRLTSGP